jgi:hypothetical protein
MTTVWFNPVKPHGTLTLTPGAFRRLDVPKIIPPRGGLIHHELYLNVTYALEHPDRPAKVRVKLVREPFNNPGPGTEPEDPTSYQGYWLMPGFSNFLITRVCYENAEAHRPTHWEIRVDGARATVGTRYAKAVMP